MLGRLEELRLAVSVGAELARANLPKFLQFPDGIPGVPVCNELNHDDKKKLDNDREQTEEVSVTCKHNSVGLTVATPLVWERRATQ